MTATTDRIKRWTALGVLGGVLGAMVMAGYAMVVSGAYKDVGYLTPLYHIASAFTAPDAMMASMEEAKAGNTSYVDAGTATVGLLVHMVTGMVAGGLFGAVAAATSLGRTGLVLAGVGYGLLVLAGNALVGLPAVAALFGGGDAIADMPAMAGWGTFTVEHLLFGAVLGGVVAAWAAGERGRHAEAPAKATTQAR
jgi:hypothetical protein